MPLPSPTSLQQPHARMNYLQPMGKLWRAKAAIMLKYVLIFLHIEKCNPGKKHHARPLALNIVHRGPEKSLNSTADVVKQSSAYMPIAMRNCKTISFRLKALSAMNRHQTCSSPLFFYWFKSWFNSPLNPSVYAAFAQFCGCRP